MNNETKSINKDFNVHENINEIVQGIGSPPGIPIRGLPSNLLASHSVEYITVDSGACDSIIPPHMFKNTPIIKHDECGRTYAACGGETVTNMGLRSVKCILPSDRNDVIHKNLNFQVGDLVTRGLLSVSQLCSMGAGVWCGPAPEYKSYIVWDKDCFIASAGPKTELFIKEWNL